MPYYSLVISLPVFVCLFWWVYFIIKTCKANTPTMRWATSFFGVSTLLYLCHYLYFSGIENYVAETIYATCNLLVYPLFYAYLMALTEHKLTLSQCLCLFIPAAFPPITYSICFALGLLETQITLSWMVRVCFAIQVLSVWGLGQYRLKNYKNSLDDYFSDDRSRVLRPLALLLHLFLLIAILSFILNLIGRGWFDHNAFIVLPATIMSVMLYVLGYVTAEIERFPHNVLNSVEKKGNIVENKKTDSVLQDNLRQALERYMQQEKAYLRQELTIDDLARVLTTNRTYISNLINTCYGVNFSQFIAQYRVEYAKQILSSQDYSLDKEAIQDAIALSGFASENTFYRQFKNITRMTPLEWRKKNIK